MGAVGGRRAGVKVPRASEGEWHFALFFTERLIENF